MYVVLLDLIKKRFRREVGGAAVKAGFAFGALALALFGVAGLFVSLFLALEPSLGALRAALSVSAVAFALALVVSAPLWWPKRRPPPPPSDLTLAQLVAFVGKTSSDLSARQMALGAVLIALALGLAAGKPPPEKK